MVVHAVLIQGSVGRGSSVERLSRLGDRAVWSESEVNFGDVHNLEAGKYLQSWEYCSWIAMAGRVQSVVEICGANVVAAWQRMEGASGDSPTYSRLAQRRWDSALFSTFAAYLNNGQRSILQDVGGGLRM